MRELTSAEILLVSGGEIEDTYGIDALGSYGISNEPGIEVAGVIGTAIAATGALVKGPIGAGLTVAGSLIDIAATLGYSPSQAQINAGYIEYGMSLAEAAAGQYSGSTFGNDFGDPNGPGAGTSYG